MSVYKRKDSRNWWYGFQYAGRRYAGTTGQLTKADAQVAEGRIKLRVRQSAAGIAPFDREASPRIQEWVETYYSEASRRVTRPDRLDGLIRVALQFWGAVPGPDSTRPLVAGAPYHDLRLIDVVTDPGWIVRWESWLMLPKTDRATKVTRTWSAQTKNQYRSLMTQIFKLAMDPRFRLASGVTTNPFAGGWRDPTYGREVVLEREDLAAILAHASYHLRVAIAIAMLAPKLREGSILGLRWDRSFSPDGQYLIVDDHKTKTRTRKPLVAYIPAQLREILTAAAERAKRTHPAATHVVTYQGRAVKKLSGAVRGAVLAASKTRPQLKYGRFVEGGVTFHTLRHTAATLLAELDVAPEKRQALMAHERLETTMKYTHLRPRHQIPAAEQLSGALPELKDLVLVPWTRAPRRLQTTVVKNTDRASRARGASRGK